MLDVLKYVANTWATWWIVGLVMSYRMIVPARDFLSDRSAEWLAKTITSSRSTTAKRRFRLGFKRYVDRTFGARQVRFGRCRFWMLRYRNAAFISFLTFVFIYTAVLLTTDYALLVEGMQRMLDLTFNPNSPVFVPEAAQMAPMVTAINPETLLITLLLMNGLMVGLVNTLADYLSFIETRNILARLGVGPWRDIFWVTIDLMLTTAFALGGFMIFWTISTYAGTAFSGRSLSVSEVAGDGLEQALKAWSNALAFTFAGERSWEVTDPAMISMTLSTYATSIWIWVFFIGTFAIRAVVLVAPLLRLVQFLIDVEEHPFRAAWLMFAILWSAGIGVATLI